MKILCCGSRDYGREDVVEQAFNELIAKYGKDHTIIEGGASGADRLCFDAALRHGLKSETYHPDWNKHGRAAGPIRNQRMLDLGMPDVVWAFYVGDTPTRGTADMIRRAEVAGVKVVRFNRKVEVA